MSWDIKVGSQRNICIPIYAETIFTIVNKVEATQVFSHRDKHGDILLLFSCRIVSYSAKPWTAALQASLSLTISRSLPKFMSTASDMGHTNHVWCHPAISSSDILFSFCPQSFPASGTFPMMVVYTWSEIFNLKKEEILMCSNMDELCKYYVKC